MSPPQQFDDRLAGDVDAARLRAATEHVADVIHATVRTQLAHGGNPVKAMVQGVVTAESWLTVMGEPGFLPPDVYAAQVHSALEELAGKLGEAEAWRWMLAPQQAFSGYTGVHALVTHRVDRVADVVHGLAPSEAASEGVLGEGPQTAASRASSAEPGASAGAGEAPAIGPQTTAAADRRWEWAAAVLAAYKRKAASSAADADLLGALEAWARAKGLADAAGETGSEGDGHD